MGIALAPDPTTTAPLDPTKPKKLAPAAAPATPGLGPSIGPSPSIGLAPQSPGKAGGFAPAMTAPAMTPPAIPAPTVAAPSAPVDRVKLATDAFHSLAGQRQTQYEADSRDNIRTSAGMGQIASGGLRTREGNLRLARERDLDALERDLTLKATEGSIADATTAYQQALAGSQQGLAAQLGLAGADAAKENADTARIGTVGGLELSKDQLELAKGEATGTIGGTATLGAQALELQKKQAAIDAQYKAGTLTLAQRNQALQELSNAQQYGLEGEKLQLARTGQEATIDLQKKQQDIEVAYQNKQITLAERDAALRELAQSQSNTLETGKLQLAKDTTGAQLAQEQQKIDLAKLSQSQSVDLAQQGLDINKMSAATAAAAQKAMEAYQNGELSLGERDAKLRELAQSQSNTIAEKGIGLEQQKVDLAKLSQADQAAIAKAGLDIQRMDAATAQKAQAATEAYQKGSITIAQRDQTLKELANAQQDAINVGNLTGEYGGTITLAKQQLDQTGKQFGLSLAQQKDLATLADKTQNRQIDASTAQGKQSLLLELARIMGSKDLSLNADFLAQIGKALGVSLPGKTPGPGDPPDPNKTNPTEPSDPFDVGGPDYYTSNR